MSDIDTKIDEVGNHIAKMEEDMVRHAEEAARKINELYMIHVRLVGQVSGVEDFREMYESYVSDALRHM